MSLTPVQTSGVRNVNATTFDSFSFPITPTPGNSVLIRVAYKNSLGSSTPFTVSDNQGNVYAMDANAGGGNQWAYVYRSSKVAASGTFTISMTAAQSTGFSWIADEIPANLALNVAAGLTGASAAPVAGPLSSSALNTLVVAVMNGGTASASPSGYTANALSFAFGTENGEFDYKVLTQLGTETPGWTIPSHFWATAIAIYQIAGALPPTVAAAANTAPAAGPVMVDDDTLAAVIALWRSVTVTPPYVLVDDDTLAAVINFWRKA